MSIDPQQVFKSIVLHNKLMTDADLDELLGMTPDPEDAIGIMVETKTVSQQLGAQLLSLYLKKLEKARAGTAPSAPTTPSASSSPTPPAAAPDTPAAPAVPVMEAVPPEHVVEAEHVSEVPAPVERKPVEDPPAPRKPAPEHYVSMAPTIVDMSKVNLSRGKKVLYEMMALARKANASDLHLKSGAPPVVRVASILRELPVPAMSMETVQECLLAVLTPEQQKKFLETNDIDLCYDAGPELGRFRTNFLQQHRGCDGIFRVISGHLPTFDELKLPEPVRRFCDYRQGVVLITGPKASGKTTTLAALIDLINSTRSEHIITIEDPIEFVHKSKKGHVNQREVGPHTNSFSNALRAALREAPDVIMVGEMRDLETTSLAITAAETGHLVFATLHTPDAVRTIGRVLDVFPPNEQGQIRAMFSESLRGIISQLLIPSVEEGKMELATEIMFNNPAIGNMIRENRAFQLRGTIQTGKKAGMVILDESIINLAKAGKISKEDAVIRAENQGFVERELAGVH